jgi:hypothetical protein
MTGGRAVEEIDREFRARYCEACSNRAARLAGRAGVQGDAVCSIAVHNGVMGMTEKPVRQSVSLPPKLAKRVGGMAKSRKLSKSRMLLELIEMGMEVEAGRQERFFALAERFRNEQDPEAARRLGDELGRMVFGG